MDSNRKIPFWKQKNLVTDPIFFHEGCSNPINGSRGRVQGVRNPTPEMTFGFLIQLMFTSGHQSVTSFLSGAPLRKKSWIRPWNCAFIVIQEIPWLTYLVFMRISSLRQTQRLTPRLLQRKLIPWLNSLLSVDFHETDSLIQISLC